jgi:hypothetical protein
LGVPSAWTATPIAPIHNAAIRVDVIFISVGVVLIAGADFTQKPRPKESFFGRDASG